MPAIFRFMRIFVIFGVLCNPVTAKDLCFKQNYVAEYCDNGCCNENKSTSPCCVINAGVIAGAVTGAVLGLIVIIGGILFLIYCANANTRQRVGATQQGVTTQVYTTQVQYPPPPGYQPYYPASNIAYPPPPPPTYSTSREEPLPPPIYVEGTRPPADHQKT